MRYHVSHLTTFDYEGPVTHCVTEAHLVPRTTPRQRVIESTVTAEPLAVTADQHLDYFGNHVSLMSILDRHHRLAVRAESVVDVAPAPAADLPAMPWEEVRERLRAYPDEDSLRACEFTFDSPFVSTSRELAAYGAPLFAGQAPIGEALVALLHQIHRDFSYTPKSTTIEMPLAEVLRRRCGVCQDFAHVMIGVLRSHGLAARYVSGYLRSGGDFTGAEASHAWVAAFIPDFGWLDLDPTNDVIPSEGHVTVAWGRDYGDVTPVKGISLGGGSQTVNVAVRVRPINEKGGQPELSPPAN